MLRVWHSPLCAALVCGASFVSFRSGASSLGCGFGLSCCHSGFHDRRVSSRRRGMRTRFFFSFCMGPPMARSLVLFRYWCMRWESGFRRRCFLYSRVVKGGESAPHSRPHVARGVLPLSHRCWAACVVFSSFFGCIACINYLSSSLDFRNLRIVYPHPTPPC
jgi:hypothetical protein